MVVWMKRPGQQVGPEYKPITSEYLDYDEVMHKYDIMMDWLAGLYVNTLNLIQYMHDKYYYEACTDGLNRYKCTDVHSLQVSQDSHM